MVLRATCGNQAAAAFLETITTVLHFWDDLVDKDKPLPDSHINKCMWMVLVELPRNPFYRANFEDLNPVLVIAIQNWLAANVMEAGDSGSDKQIAFITRSSYVDIVIQTATICGGFEFGQGIALEARRLWHGEGFDGYLANLQKQFTDAEIMKGGQDEL
jgi:hypothetical protein